MTEKAPRKDPVPRRLLGDKWLDWNGEKGRDVASADTGVGVSLALAGVAALLLVGLLMFLWYLVTPRLNEIHPAAPWIFGALAISFSVFILALGGSLILTVVTGRNFLLLRNIHRFLLGTVFLLHRIGKRFGISADRVSNSLLKINNALILATRRFSGTERVLLLLPRCLTREIRQEIMAVADSIDLKHAICGGGEDARKKILLERPEIVVAVACERDLIAGIRDVPSRLPVIGIPNSRPRGPCKCTEIDINTLFATLSQIMGGKKITAKEETSAKQRERKNRKPFRTKE